jgi:pyruvate kinase
MFAEHAISLNPGDNFVLDSDKTPGDRNRVELPHPEIFAALKPGDRLLLDDGKVRLRVVECSPTRATTAVEVGTKLSDRKGVSVPDTTVDFGALTTKDRADLEAALNADVDWIALSFIQRPEDLAEVREIVGGRAGILAKIEKPQAVEHLAGIIEHADALMVARGDLGVEMPLERVPGIQKQITRAARRAGKPVVVATQMLESMISAPVPTRAEVSDVATAVFEGADAIMLSAESASGAYPVEAVATMDRIATEVERDPIYKNIMHAQRTEPEATGADAISAAARQIAETLNLAAICCYTASGATAMRAARERPQTPIIAFSPIIGTARRLSLVWGLHCVAGEEPQTLEEMINHACQVARDEGFAKPGERIIVTAGLPLGRPGATNLIRIAYVDE